MLSSVMWRMTASGSTPGAAVGFGCGLVAVAEDFGFRDDGDVAVPKAAF